MGKRNSFNSGLGNDTWIGVDLDGTLAKDTGFRGLDFIGPPIASVVSFVQDLVAKGETVKIFTARLSNEGDAVSPIKKWCLKNLGFELEVTNVKDMWMKALYDDKAYNVSRNTGIISGGIMPDPDDFYGIEDPLQDE